MPLFSVVLATRDRPSLFAEALASVLAQDFTDKELIVVNDGSKAEHMAAYDALLGPLQVAGKVVVRVHKLPRRERGHGQSYSLNVGSVDAAGDYLCFLDDDDCWTDPQHLSRAARIIGRSSQEAPLDLFFSNQSAYLRNEKREGPIWLEDLAERLQRQGLQADADGTFSPRLADIIETGRFSHVNCLIVRKALFEAIGGFDEDIRWENDRDFFLRLMDHATKVAHHPACMSRHNIPDPAATTNITTSIPSIHKRLYQLKVFDKAALFARDPLIRQHGQLHKGYTLKKISVDLAEAKKWSSAAYYARTALGTAPGLKWMLFTVYCFAQSLMRR